MQLGTNDLASCSPLQVGSELEELVRLLHESYGVHCVCVCQTIRRRSAPAFNKSVDMLSRYLRVVLKPIPYALYWGHRGFWKAGRNFLFSDGVHLNSRGQHKLYRSLREAVLKSLTPSNISIISSFCYILSLLASSFDILLSQALIVSDFDYLLVVAHYILGTTLAVHSTRGFSL